MSVRGLGLVLPATNIVMFELLQLFSRRRLVFAIASWILFAVIHVVLVSGLAWSRYASTPESTLLDRLWFVYTETPKALPMVFVYALGMVFVSQVLGSLISINNPDNLTMGQWHELRRTSPIKAIVWMSIRVSFILGLVGMTIIFVASPLGLGWPVLSWLAILIGMLLGLTIFPLLFNPWIRWFTQESVVDDKDPS